MRTRRQFLAAIFAALVTAPLARLGRRARIGDTLSVRYPARFLATPGKSLVLGAMPCQRAYNQALSAQAEIIEHAASDLAFVGGDRWQPPELPRRFQPVAVA